ncbi:hypothetical protein N7526_008712 [Penicillium atrosanguineum]|nr:hypothetical protein N7526_008712 [Penicillium atrosanguineum]
MASELLEARAQATAQLYADPHNPHLYLNRARLYEKLGFPDLAAADAYRALSLLESVVDPDGFEFHAKKVVKTVIDTPATQKDNGDENEDENEDEDEEKEEDDGTVPVTQDEYDALIGDVYIVLVVVSSAVDATVMPTSSIKTIYKFHTDVQGDIDLESIDSAALPAQGKARRVLYPWNKHEPDRRAPEELRFLNERLAEIAPKCEVRAVALPALHNSATGEEEVSVQLGLFAKEDIAADEIILHTVFCSQACHDKAQTTYHGAICGLEDGLESIGKDIPDPKDKADYLYLLLLGRALAMSATQDVDALELPEVKYIWGDFHDFDMESTNAHDDATLPFSFQLNILQPTRFLEEMEIDPYASLPRYDTWALNTLYAKFRGTASGRLSTWDGGPELCAVHPLWCLANHSCDPNVTWEWGGEITFRCRNNEETAVWSRTKSDGAIEMKPLKAGGIAKDQEILNHYCDIGLPVKKRREWASGALGGTCRCDRCAWEAGETN